MIDFLEIIVAARKKGGGWIVPIIFVVIYIVSTLGKLKRGGAEEDIELEKRPSLRDRDTEGKFRYKALDEASGRQRPAGQRSVPPSAKSLLYAKPGAPGAGGHRPAPRQPLQVQPRQPQPVAHRPQPTVQPGPARVPFRMRPQTSSVRPGPTRPAAPKQRRVEPTAAPRAPQKLRKPQKAAAAVVSEPPAEVVRKRRTLRQDLSGSSNLQRAIIYSEILGKPLALRDM